MGACMRCGHGSDEHTSFVYPPTLDNVPWSGSVSVCNLCGHLKCPYFVSHALAMSGRWAGENVDGRSS